MNYEEAACLRTYALG